MSSILSEFASLDHSSETEEQTELERHVEANERSNMSAQPKATPTQPNECL